LSKVAYILTPVDFAGAEKVSLTFLRNVNREKFDIQPILLVRPWDKDNLFIKHMKEIDYYPYTIPVAIKPPSDGRDYFRVARCVLSLYQILTRESFDLVHSHGYFADIIATIVCKYTSIPHLATCHGFISNNVKLKIYNRLNIVALQFCEKIITVSSEIMKYLVKCGIDKSKVVVIQNAIERQEWKKDFARIRLEKRKSLVLDQDVLIIGYVGRLSEEKGIQYLIKAATVLKEMNGKFVIIILGDGPKRCEFENLARSLGLQKELKFIGFVTDVESWLTVLDIFVLPSLTEGTPMALLEAMAMGIPVIASAVGGVPDVVESGVNGYLVSPGDYRELGKKMMLLMNNHALRVKMSKEAINKINKEFDVKHWCEKIELQYNEIIN